MKTPKLFIVSVILIAFSPAAFRASAQWTIQSSTTTVMLKCASFVDSLNGWVVGDSGIVLHTTDAGNVWNRQASGTTVLLHSVSFYDVGNGWAAGAMGTILRTSDGGNNWMRLVHDTSANVRNFKVQCMSPSTAIVLRDSFTNDVYQNTRIWMTTDNGVSWSDISPYSGGFSYLRDLSFVTPSSGWACGVGGNPHGYQFHRTTNGGLVWLTEHFNNPTLWAMQRVFFTSVLDGWATDWDTVYRTSDGGVIWGRVGIPLFNDLSDFVMLSNTGYASRIIGRIKKTTDGGATWFEQASAPPNFIEDLEFVTPNVGWAVGWNGQIVHTVNGGTTSVGQPSEIPEKYLLMQNFPNPFNPTTRIAFAVPRHSRVSIIIYDVLGRYIDKVVDREFSVGLHEVDWKPQNISGGVYFYQLIADGFSSTKSLMLMK